MHSFQTARLALSALTLCALAACGGGGGGGGGDSGSDSATLKVITPTSATSVGTYTSGSKTQAVEDLGTNLGKATSTTFAFGKFEAGVSVVNSDNSIYVLGFSDATGDYVCVVAKAAATTGLRACPSGVTVDSNARTAQFTNAVLAELDSPTQTVTVTGNFSWK